MLITFINLIHYRLCEAIAHFNITHSFLWIFNQTPVEVHVFSIPLSPLHDNKSEPHPSSTIQKPLRIALKFNLLCVGLFEQGRPELVALNRVHINQLPLVRRQPVVDADFHPLTELPQVEAEQT